jgi:hypothetical protein
MPPSAPDAQLSLAMIAGIFALAGVAVGHLLTMLAAWRDRKRRRSDLLLSKLDELAVEDRVLQTWLAEFQTKETVLDAQALTPELPCSRMEVLASIYFERLKQPVAQYTQSLRAYYTWVFATLPQLPNVSKDGRLPNPLLWCLARSDKDSVERLLREIQSCRRTLSDSVTSEAKRLLG